MNQEVLARVLDNYHKKLKSAINLGLESHAKYALKKLQQISLSYDIEIADKLMEALEEALEKNNEEITDMLVDAIAEEKMHKKFKAESKEEEEILAHWMKLLEKVKGNEQKQQEQVDFDQQIKENKAFEGLCKIVKEMLELDDLPEEVN